MFAFAGALIVRIAPACEKVAGMKRWPMSKLCVVELRPKILTLPMVCIRSGNRVRGVGPVLAWRAKVGPPKFVRCAGRG